MATTSQSSHYFQFSQFTCCAYGQVKQTNVGNARFANREALHSSPTLASTSRCVFSQFGLEWNIKVKVNNDFMVN